MKDDIWSTDSPITSQAEPAGIAGELRTPKAAAIAGILFALMLGVPRIAAARAASRPPTRMKSGQAPRRSSPSARALVTASLRELTTSLR